jgi:hypothetical protein
MMAAGHAPVGHPHADGRDHSFRRAFRLTDQNDLPWFIAEQDAKRGASIIVRGATNVALAAVGAHGLDGGREITHGGIPTRSP